jgi:hypothetical protein
MLEAIKMGRMPKGKPHSVSEEEVAMFETWVHGGAPDN